MGLNPGWRRSQEKEMATNSSVLAWDIARTEKPGGLQSMGPKSWTELSNSGEGNGNPLRYSCLESPVDRGAWWAAVHGVAQSQT